MQSKVFAINSPSVTWVRDKIAIDFIDKKS